MTGAMYAAVAGLKTHMSALNVIGNNVANVNTNAYKATRYVFSEALYTSVHSGSDGTNVLGGRNPAQLGYGVSMGSIDIDMSTKSFYPTGTLLDCMIDGDGFFIVGDKTKTGITTQEQLQGMSLSRLGNFQFIDGYLVDGEGQIVYGFLNHMVEDEDAEDGTGTTTESIPILTPIRLPKMYETTDEDGDTVTNIIFPQLRSDAENGDTVETVELDTLDDFVDDAPDELREEDLKWIQLENLSIEENGRIIGSTSDKKQVVVGYVALAKVDNPNGVTHVDGHYYQAMGGAGQLNLCSPGAAVQYVANADAAGDDRPEGTVYNTHLTIGQAGNTTLINGGLELGGTDLATEISNMISIQRGYQANTRIVTVSDSMLEELVNMKR